MYRVLRQLFLSPIHLHGIGLKPLVGAGIGAFLSDAAWYLNLKPVAIGQFARHQIAYQRHHALRQWGQRPLR